MKKIIRLDAIFTLEEQIDIVWEIGGIIQKYEGDKVHEKRRYYFLSFAEKYALAHRVTHQLEAYRKDILRGEELATNEDLANLFLVGRSTVSRYLQNKLSPQDFKDRAALLREVGGARGGSNSSTRGYKQKRIWSRKKK